MLYALRNAGISCPISESQTNLLNTNINANDCAENMQQACNLQNEVSDVGEKLEDKIRQCSELSNKLFDRDTAFVKEREIGCALRNEVKELNHENSNTIEELRAKDKQIG